MKRILILMGVLLLWSGAASSSTFLPEQPKALSPDQIDLLKTLPPGQTYLMIDDMKFKVSNLEKSGFVGDRWTDGIVYYTFDGGVTAAQRDNWRLGAFHWTCAADLQFIEGEGDGDYIFVFTGSGNWSEVGMTGGEQEMSIVSWNRIFTISHEIGHALGLIHEQSRSDRDSFVQVHLDRVCQDCCSGDPCDHNFDIEGSSDNYGDYDFDSVMHYPQCAFNICADCSADLANCRTITVLEPWAGEWQDRIGQREYLSVRDKAGMAARYSPTLNHVPVAMCRPFIDEADGDCCIQVTVADIDDGSYDPDGAGDVVSLCITELDGMPVDCEQSVEVCEVGNHTVTLTITDECGETSSCDATVTVIDVTPPTMTIDLNRNVLWPPNHKMVDILVTVTSEDNCDDDPAIALVSVVSNEPDDGLGDGHTSPDIMITDDFTIQLRSERLGGGDGRYYTLTYSATDFSGNQTIGEVFVTVPHDQSGTALAFSGFLPDGSDVDTSARTFALVVPSVDVDATTIDPYHAYVGNTEVCLRPLSSRLIDMDRNGVQDLVVHYSMKAVARFIDFPTPINDGAESIEVETVTGGTLGLHYRAGEVDYLVPDIRVLGKTFIVPVGLNSEFDGGNNPDLPTGGGSALRTEITSVHPNPFNPLTRIRFNVGETSLVTLRIYDYRGNLVRELRNEAMAPGPYEVVWDGRDRKGMPVAAGVYLSLLTDGKARSTQKLVLLK
ncbi:MAG: M12 family metallopeptidase [Candidatus Krumholzibacteriota bacterium]